MLYLPLVHSSDGPYFLTGTKRIVSQGAVTILNLIFMMTPMTHHEMNDVFHSYMGI